VVYSYTTQDEVINPVTPRKYTVLNENFVFDLRKIFQDCIPDAKRDLPVMFVVCITFLYCSLYEKISLLHYYYYKKFPNAPVLI